MRRLVCVLSLSLSSSACSDDGSASSLRDAAASSAGHSGSGDASHSGGSSSDASGGSGAGSEPAVYYGAKHEGGEFHLGPVNYDESHFHNACAPGTKYAPAIRNLEGLLLAGLWNGITDVASYCDACIEVTTQKGKQATLRVVTYGDTTPNSIDVSPEAYAILDSGEYPRAMTWQFVKCPDTGKLVFEFQTGSNEWWTSLWVRNARVPIKRVEVKSQNHSSFVALERGTDGTLTDDSGFGAGPFTLRLTGIDDSVVMEAFAWPRGGIAGATLMGQGNFP